MSKYLEKLNELQSFENGILFYGMWKGYQEQENLMKNERWYDKYSNSRRVVYNKSIIDLDG